MIHLVLPPDLAQQLADLAAVAAPAECCGLIEGRRDGDTIHVVQLHPARNLAGLERFAIAPDDHIAAQRAARQAGNALVGCYHSHPDTLPVPSAADLAGAGEEDLVWLIAGAGPGGWDLAAFIFTESRFEPVYLVMSSE